MVTMAKRETFQDLEFLVTLLSENIWSISSIIVLSWDIVQWRGIGKKNKIFKIVTRHIEDLKLRYY